MNIKMILFILAAICFALDAGKVSGPLSWTPAGFCLLTIGALII